MSRVTSELSSLARRWGSQSATLAIAQPIGLLLVAIFALALLGAFWLAVVVLSVGMAVARKRWPKVRLRYYFITRKLALPAVLLAGGVGAQYVAAAVAPSFSGVVSSTAGMLAGGVVSAIALYLSIEIFQEKIMMGVFQLVPAEQRAGFEERLDAIDTAARGAEGQAADFSALDQTAVTRTIAGRVIGQDATVAAAVVTAFRRARLALARPHKPVAAFLFVGSTGSGKTELAKALAEEMFGGRMVRVDCNELSAESNAARLIGAPPGYVGSADGSAFCREIGRLGTGVILFDEIEKAHPVVLKTIMGLLDEARITEQSTSRTYSARGFLIVLTSNAAQAEIGKIAQAETDPTNRDVKVKDALRDGGFLPEVLARLDAVFPFAPLSARALASIIERFLLRFASDAGVELVSADAAVLLDLVTKAIKTKDYGVREVVRGVESAVVDGLLNVRDHGYRRALIRVTDGRVDVQPVSSDSAGGGPWVILTR